MAISEREYMNRYKAIRELMAKEGLDCLLVAGTGDDFNRGNIRYLTGSGRGGYCVLGPEDSPVFLTGPNQSTNPKFPLTVEAFNLLELKETIDQTKAVLEQLSRRHGGNQIGLVGLGCIPVPMYLSLKERFGELLVDAVGIFEKLREIKSPEELEKTRTAAKIADAVYSMLRKTIKPGMGEFEIYASVKKTVYEMGCEYSFDLIDAADSSMNMSFHPTADRLEADGTLFMEITPAYQGYYAQLPVTLPVFNYRPRVRKMVEAWNAADNAARKVLHPGTMVSELNTILIETVRSHGFDSPHRPGHSIGLDALDFWSITADNHRLLQPGMVLAVHPSVIAEFGGEGCGMGYTYIITGTGAEQLSQIDLASDLLK
jgi:Xaa-Pro aminopeptidase